MTTAIQVTNGGLEGDCGVEGKGLRRLGEEGCSWCGSPKSGLPRRGRVWALPCPGGTEGCCRPKTPTGAPLVGPCFAQRVLRSVLTPITDFQEADL